MGAKSELVHDMHGRRAACGLVLLHWRILTLKTLVRLPDRFLNGGSAPWVSSDSVTCPVASDVRCEAVADDAIVVFDRKR